MTKLLCLSFDKKKDDQALEIFLVHQTIDDMTLCSDVKVYYRGGFYLTLTWDSFDYAITNHLMFMLKKALNNELALDNSIKKDLGFYLAKYHKNKKNKCLKYKIGPDGYQYWIGFNYNVYNASSSYQQYTWIYNDKEGNIIFEITPSYTWSYNWIRDGEIFTKYSDWLKTYKPYMIKKISKETAQEWITQLDELIEKVTKNDERLTCTGPGCEMCKQGMPLHQ
ncbi:hypothetical protein HYV11_03695 [Candidatus Dependentiae bacterium]|nr:hypothetical protein [Candidatus Dependentiae bacterium]